MDQNLLLTVEKLTLNPDIQRGVWIREVCVIKNVPAQTYLTVSREQAVVLEAFTNGETVPKVFARLLEERSCLPLREFYELVVKAHRAGILLSGQTRKPVRNPLRWPALRAGFLCMPAAAGALAVLVWLAWAWPGWPDEWASPAVGGVIATAMLIAGGALAASALTGASGEVYARKTLLLPAWIPVRCDLRDSRLLRPREQLTIMLAESLPLSVAVLLALWKFPAAAWSIAVVWLLVWRPWGEGMPRRLTALWSRYPNLDTDADFQFLPNQRPQLHWRPWWRRWDLRVCLVELLVAAGWTLLVGRIVLGELKLSFVEVVSDWRYWLTSLPWVAAALMLSIVVIIVRRWKDGLRQAWRQAKQRWTTAWRRWRQEHVFSDNEPALLRLAAAHPLLGLLNPYDQATLVRAWRPAVRGAWAKLAEGEEGPHVGLILSGSARGSRGSLNGRRGATLALEEGDFFGLPKIKSDANTLMEVRSRTPIAALLVPTEVFKSVVMGRLESQVVYDLTHKYSFLRRLPLCAHWHAHAVARFARISQIATYADGDCILHEHEDSRWFYIVYDGIAQVRRRGKLVSRLKTGDFFGEISLLQNSVTIADVVAQGRVQCLQLDRASFLRFMTHNHHVALQLEKVSSERLGRPVFPLAPGM